MSGMGSHQSAKSLKDEWLTPKYIVDACGPFMLDPCSPINRPWDTAKIHYTIRDDGLALPWVGRVWCNPPYGRETGVWLDLLKKHNNGVALIFARTETRDWFNHVWGDAHSILFIKGRLHFHHVDGTRAKANSGAPSALIAYGKNNSEFLRLSGIEGKHIYLKD